MEPQQEDQVCLQRHWFLIQVEIVTNPPFGRDVQTVTAFSPHDDLTTVGDWIKESLEESFPLPATVKILDVRDCGWIPNHDAQKVLQSLTDYPLGDVFADG